MKSFIRSVILWAAAVCLIPIAAGAGREEETAPVSAEISAVRTETEITLPADRLSILSSRTGDLRTVTLEEYTVFALLEEIPCIMDGEAMKAQACAARTYAARRILSGEDSASGAHMTDDDKMFQVCFTEEQARAVYGSGYEEALAAAKRAADETSGEIIAFEGEPACTPFHISSGENTESSESAWGIALPYLVKVRNPENAVTCSSRSFTPAELGARIAAAYPSACAPGNVEIRYRDGSGLAAEAELCGVSVEGGTLARILSLDSAAYSVQKTEEGYIFTVSGEGHLVGMSMTGAQEMSLEGYDYRDILAHYYPGTEVTCVGIREQTNSKANAGA